MNRTIVVAGLLIATALSAFAQKQDEAKPEKIVQPLRQFESDWLMASLNQDERWLDRFFAGKLLVIPFESGALKNRTRETIELIDPKLKSEEMKARITGNVTLLTNAGNRSYYFLDTFNRRGGKWQVIATHFSRTPEPNNENIEQTIMQMEREWNTLTVKRDAAGLRRIIADDFVGVESSGSAFNKAQIINVIETGGDIQSEAAEDLKVRVYGDTAVVTGRFSIKSKKNEADDNLKLLFTNVWTRRDGQWFIVSHQATQKK